MNHKWIYKGHICELTQDIEEDCTKICHYVQTPNGRKMEADISPYNTWSQIIVEMWIDLEYPDRNGIGPLTMDDIKEMWAKKFPKYRKVQNGMELIDDHSNSSQVKA